MSSLTNKKLRLGNFTKSVTAELPYFNGINVNKPNQENVLQPEISFNSSNVYQNLTLELKADNPCVNCKGQKLACGKMKCPIVTKITTYSKNFIDLEQDSIFGSSPPGVFVGRFGYPKINIGPMIPPEIGDTSLYDTTELWFGLPLNDILNFRMKLVRAKFSVNVSKPQKSNKFLELTQEMGLARNYIETEVTFKKKPHQKITLDANIQPMGPIAPLKNLELGSSKTDHRIEKSHYDTDLLANEAILQLNKKGVTQSAITRAFSLGLFGQEKKRKLVPTRWSITAIDSALGLSYWRQIQHLPLINESRVFESTYMGNRFVVLMFPGVWGYELIEAWFPNSAWNPGNTIAMVNDYEGLKGRKTYARIGGCYYAGRNMVGNYLANEQRQARIVVLRETYPGQQMPMGVWLVREMIRKALEFPYIKFDTVKEAFEFIEKRLLIKPTHWHKISGILSNAPEVQQKSLHTFLK